MLHLRFRAAETDAAPPELASFTAVDRSLLGEQDADHDDRTALADLVAAGLVNRHVRLIVDDLPGLGGPVFVTLRATPIPAPEGVEAAPEVAAFVLADRVCGHFAWPAARRRGPALALAACLPLALPSVAQAQAPGTSRSAETVESVVPPAPPPVVDAGSLAVRPLPPPPRITSAGGQLETILQAMKGREAVVYAAGAKVTGLIIGVDGDFVTIIDAERDGKIALIPKAQIVEVRGRSRQMSTPYTDLPTGTGNLVGGGILVGIGAPLMLSGLVFLGIVPSFVVVYLPQILPAGVMLGVGIPNLVIGSRKRRAYQAAMRPRLSDRLAPAVSRTPHGSWTGGLTLRF
jgi:hypothetical protein